LPPLSSGGALVAQPWLRFHTPLIEPDRQVCRVAQPLLAFAPTDPTVRRYRSGLFRKDPRRADRLAASFTRARFGCKDCQRCVWPFAGPVVIPSCRSLFSIASFPSATSSIIWSGPTPIRDAANYGCPSFAAPAGDHRRTRMGLIGSGMGLLAVTWSKPPAEHPVSRVTRPDVLLSLVRAPALPPQHADFGSQFHTPSNRCLRFGPRVSATPARLAPVLPARR
jgi:hypothetical protein